MPAQGEQLVQRYKDNFHLPRETPLTEEMVLWHWGLEKSLRDELLASSAQNRWEVFERCYSTLYGELYWLNQFSSQSENDVGEFADWFDIIGSKPRTIFEVGSGKGRLILALAERGHHCKGTEVTRERGAKWAQSHPNLTWGTTDGVNLELFEPANHYDLVISDQVVEHLHPDDLLPHFQGAHKILKSDGKYIFRTPHVCIGPSDVSRVFGTDQPMGMHLKEYTYKELCHALREAGFRKVTTPLRVPRQLRAKANWLGAIVEARSSVAYLEYLRLVESLLTLLPATKLRRRVTAYSKLLYFSPSIFLIAEK
jgi:SAM-dependent methyltransferase